MLQVSFISFRGLLVHPVHAGPLSVIHTASFPVLLNPRSPRNPVSCLPPTLLLNVYTKSVTQPQPFRSFPFVFPSLSLSLLSLHPSLFALVFSVSPLLRRQWRRQTGREDIRWCTARLERKNGRETAEERKIHRLIRG